MQSLENKSVLVIGLGRSGLAACRFLLVHKARVMALDSADTPVLQREANQIVALGAEVRLAAETLPEGAFDLAVVSPGVPLTNKLIVQVRERGIPLIGELELGFQYAACLNVSISGTNGKTTTTELVARILTHAQRKTVAAGNIGLPLCEVADQSRELDLLTLEVSSFQLETIEFFRPAVAVLMNITPDHMDRHGSMPEYVRAKARLFVNQQAFDWAIVQTEALAQIRSQNLPVKAKVITFSANNRRADIYLDRGLIISQLPDWSGPLLDMDDCLLKGPHNAENLMAALAVGRVLRIPLEVMQEALKSYVPAPHRCELVATINGVKFINDSKSTNLDSLHKALLSTSASKPGEPNVWLIAGGKDKGFEYHDIGPLLAQRVKHAFLLGETREKLRAAWSLFTPCTPVNSLLEAVSEAASNAVSGDIILLSPACSSFDMFQNYQHRGEVFRQAVSAWEHQTGSGVAALPPISGGGTSAPQSAETGVSA